MQKNMKKDNKAVSPVIGVILMVVITVIIAAVLAVFAFGIGGPTKAPQTQLKFVATFGASATTNTFSVTNSGGDSLTRKDERLFVKDAFSNAAVAALDDKLLSDTAFLLAGNYLTPGLTVSATGTLGLTTGQVLRVQILDVPTGQMIADTKVTVQ